MNGGDAGRRVSLANKYLQRYSLFQVSKLSSHPFHSLPFLRMLKLYKVLSLQEPRDPLYS
jgi:hypothetical protein